VNTSAHPAGLPPVHLLTCPRRAAVCAETLARWARTDWPGPPRVFVDLAPESPDLPWGDPARARRLTDAFAAMLRSVLAGDVVIQSNLDWGRIQQLLETYQQRMDWTDACMVQLSELHRDCRVLTVDKEDFAIYRRLRNQAIPTLSPP